MTNFDRYEEIFSTLETPEEQLRALAAYWQSLNESCTKENRCSECLRHEEGALDLEEQIKFDYLVDSGALDP